MKITCVFDSGKEVVKYVQEFDDDQATLFMLKRSWIEMSRDYLYDRYGDKWADHWYTWKELHDGQG